MAVLIMGIVLVAACVALLPVLLARAGAGTDVLEASFMTQSLRVGDAVLPAAALEVLHRSTGTASYSRAGDLMQIDASWLCRAPDGSWLLALGQGLRHENELAVMPWNRTPLPISWTWRHLSEDQARHALLHDRRACRHLFGAG